MALDVDPNRVSEENITMPEIEMVMCFRSLDEPSQKRFFGLVEMAANEGLSIEELEYLASKTELILKDSQ